MVGLSSLIKTDHKVVDKREPLRSVQAWVTGESDKVPIVVDDGKPIGIVDERALMGRHRDLNTRIHQFTLTTRALSEDASLDDARQKMAEFRAAYLPVEDPKGKLLGYVTAVDIAREESEGKSARDLSKPVSHLREDQTMGDAIHLFQKEHVEFLPVMSDNGSLGGVLARADVLRMSFDGADRGRRDAGGEKVGFLSDAVSGFMDRAPMLVRPDAAPSAVLDQVGARGYVLVGASDQGPVEVATAETLFTAGTW